MKWIILFLVGFAAARPQGEYEYPSYGGEAGVPAEPHFDTELEEAPSEYDYGQIRSEVEENEGGDYYSRGLRNTEEQDSEYHAEVQSPSQPGVLPSEVYPPQEQAAIQFRNAQSSDLGYHVPNPYEPQIEEGSFSAPVPAPAPIDEEAVREVRGTEDVNQEQDEYAGYAVNPTYHLSAPVSGGHPVQIEEEERHVRRALSDDDSDELSDDHPAVVPDTPIYSDDSQEQVDGQFRSGETGQQGYHVPDPSVPQIEEVPSFAVAVPAPVAPGYDDLRSVLANEEEIGADLLDPILPQVKEFSYLHVPQIEELPSFAVDPSYHAVAEQDPVAQEGDGTYHLVALEEGPSDDLFHSEQETTVESIIA